MNYSVVYECVDSLPCHKGCGKVFYVSSDDAFDHDPSTRCCPFCKAIGIAYRGPKNYVTPYVQSDNMGGVQGLKSMADGKMYDSKAAYYASLKEKGYEVVGNDAPTTRGTPKTEAIDWKQALHETYQQLSPTNKGKK